ncbi:MAG: alpha/beta hydrolase [Parachlamydiaceae bacterium]|nr:alpha/beta hydrolase [Parachlamydiaceae bacterium]
MTSRVSSSASSNHTSLCFKVCTTIQKICSFLYSVSCDVLLIPGAGILTLFTSCYKSDPTVHNIRKDKTPILFIHGNGYNEMQWVVGRYFLSKDKELGSMFSLRLDGLLSNKSENGIEEYAAKVAVKVQEIANLTGLNDVTLVGHSMGGLVAAHYA